MCIYFAYEKYSRKSANRLKVLFDIQSELVALSRQIVFIYSEVVMSGESKTANPLLPILDTLLLNHPLPWRVERDWSHEVGAEDGTIVAKCMTYEEAETIVDYATRRQAELDEHCREADQFLADMGAEEKS